MKGRQTRATISALDFLQRDLEALKAATPDLTAPTAALNQTAQQIELQRQHFQAGESAKERVFQLGRDANERAFQAWRDSQNNPAMRAEIEAALDALKASRLAEGAALAPVLDGLAANGLKQIKTQHGAASIGALASAISTS